MVGGKKGNPVNKQFTSPRLTDSQSKKSGLVTRRSTRTVRSSQSSQNSSQSQSSQPRRQPPRPRPVVSHESADENIEVIDLDDEETNQLTPRNDENVDHDAMTDHEEADQTKPLDNDEIDQVVLSDDEDRPSTTNNKEIGQLEQFNTIEEFESYCRDELSIDRDFETDLDKSTAGDLIRTKILERIKLVPEKLQNVPYGFTLKRLSHHVTKLNDTVEDLRFAKENVNVINQISKRYVMIHHEKSDTIWNDIAFCLIMHPREGDHLFFNTVKMYIETADSKDLIEFVEKDKLMRQVMMLSIFCNYKGSNLYKYKCVTSRECMSTVLRMEPNLCNDHLEKIENGSVQLPMMPGSSLVFSYTIGEQMHSSSVLIGVFGNYIYPFVEHSSDPVNLDEMVVFQMDISEFKETCRRSLSNQMKLSSPEIIKSLSNDGAVFGLGSDYSVIKNGKVELRVLAPILIPFKKMNSEKLAKQHNDRIQEFGCAIFKANDYDQFKPTLNMGEKNIIMDFKRQSFAKIGDGIYILTNSDITHKMTPDEAMRAGIKDLMDMQPMHKIGKYLVTTGPIKTKKPPFPPGSVYLYYHGETCPVIFGWDDNEKILLCEKTSGLQAALKYYKIEGINTHHYYVSFANSYFQVHVENRGLQAASFLLVGTKIWIVIPKRNFPKFMMWLEHMVGDDDIKKCRNWFMHKVLFLDVSFLPESFGVTLVVQRAGELLILDNLAVHWGWNVDFNVAFAFNFSMNPNWDTVQHLLPICDHTDKENCSDPVLTTEQLMVLRMHDSLLSSTMIPTNHITDSQFNRYWFGWNDPYERPGPINLESNKAASNHTDPISADSAKEDDDVDSQVVKANPSRDTHVKKKKVLTKTQNKTVAEPSLPIKRKRKSNKTNNPIPCSEKGCGSKLKNLSSFKMHLHTQHETRHPDAAAYVNEMLRQYEEEKNKTSSRDDGRSNKKKSDEKSMNEDDCSNDEKNVNEENSFDDDDDDSASTDSMESRQTSKKRAKPLPESDEN